MKPWMFVLVVVLLLATCTARPGDRTLYPVRYGQEQVTVYLVDNGYHIDIALPAEALAKAGGPTAEAARQVTPRDWVVVGWGDAKFYTERGRSLERALDGLRAALKPGNPSVVRLIGLDRSPDALYGPDAVPLELSRESFELMVGRIDRSLGGQARRAEPPGSEALAYFHSIETFSILHLCNHWTAEVLNAGGIGVTPMLDTTTAGLRLDLWLGRFVIDQTLDTNRLRT